MKEKLDKFVERYFDNVVQMETYNELVAKVLESVKRFDPNLYSHFHEEIDKMLDHIYYDMVEDVLNPIHNRDGSYGPKWDYETVKSVIHENHLKDEIEDFDCLIFWYVMNKEYATHSNKERPVEYFIDTALEEIEYYGNKHFEDEIKGKYTTKVN
jgi:hypothetical protein